MERTNGQMARFKQGQRVSIYGENAIYHITSGPIDRGIDVPDYVLTRLSRSHEVITVPEVLIREI